LLQRREVEVPLFLSQFPNAAERIAALLKGLPPADAKLQDFLKSRRQGFLAARHNFALGAEVFEKKCAACHQIGGKGARVGPQLDGIGARGVERLLEDVLDPNRNVDQTFRVTSLALNDGRLVAGLLLKEEGAVLVLADSQGKEVRVPKDTVEEQNVSPLSPMPANLGEQMNESELYNLLAFLLEQRTQGGASASRAP
jgi:putative heme-binding domain-containing protein